MTDLFDTHDGFAVQSPEVKETPRQKAERAYRDLNNRSYAETAINRAGRNASPEDLRSISFAILEEAKNRESK